MRRHRDHDRINQLLSDELILEILRHVDSKSSHGAISLVCRRWFELERLSCRSVQVGASDHHDSLAAVCDICGDIGVPDLLVTCSNCKTNCEHAYCRKVLPKKFSDDWACDNCNGKKMDPHENEKREKHVTFALGPPDCVCDENTHSALTRKYQKKEKFVTKGKVKCISSKEAIMLCSGSKKGEAVRIDRPVSSKTVVHKNDASFKSPEDPVSLPSNKQMNSMTQRQGNNISNDARDAVKPAMKTKLASSGKEICRPSEASSAPSLEKQLLQPVSSVAVTPPVETRAASKRKEASMPKEAIWSLKKHLKKPRTSVKADTKTKVMTAGKEASHQVKSDKFSRGPADASSWKGQFKFFDEILRNTKFENEARPCSITSRKVLEFSTRMPQSLHFKLIRRNKVWTHLFQDGCASADDIGLYFYSGKKDRSSGYDLVLALIEAQDLALRCELHGVVLYLFTSKTLSAEYQTWDGHHYLWGVLHKMKKLKDITKLYKELPPKVPQRSEARNNNI